MRDIYNGKRQYPYPTPMVPGTSAIGRVAATGPDSTLLTSGDLVFIDCLIRGRDDPSAVFISGIHEGYSAGSKTLMQGEWRDSTFAEFAKVPLECCTILNEKRLLGDSSIGGLSHQDAELSYMSTLLIPYGGLRDVGLQPGETIIISPATGSFGGAAVLVALAMGARVIALGRDEKKLAKIKDSLGAEGRVETVKISGDVQADTAALKTFGFIDVFFDISPPEAAQSTHFKSGILALKHSGRVSLMGGIKGDVSIPHSIVMHKNLRIQGKWMYEREDIVSMVKMIETGVLRVGKGAGVTVAGRFGLDEWEHAFDVASDTAGMGTVSVMVP